MIRLPPNQTDNIWNSRTAAVTAEVLKEYKEMISITTSDLEGHLQKIDNRLRTLSPSGARISGQATAEGKRLQEEMDSIKQCLAICMQASEQTDQTRTNDFEDISAGRDAHQ